ncbi:hypothetical protein ILP92_03820 [Maribius pontilimi]|uniref:Uncharacterized protein n=1 Tax=Palleronia pontilimi TaxID=1964209 RepID=A0A934I7G6_9RHOB|nr:hypothetical protein [Palleronia pontilimi]MBJ3761874.1 hypothetical protein [Palleronia pontilimi]
MTGPLTLSAAIGAVILAVLLVRAFYVLRVERDQRPGSLPGQGHHKLRSEYFSGGGGGGQASEYTVPKDPQAYALLFVPKTTDKKDK